MIVRARLRDKENESVTGTRPRGRHCRLGPQTPHATPCRSEYIPTPIDRHRSTGSDRSSSDRSDTDRPTGIDRTATDRDRDARALALAIEPVGMNSDLHSPVRRVSFLVTRQRFDALDPASDRGEFCVDREESPTELLRFAALERTEQNLNARKHDDVRR